MSSLLNIGMSSLFASRYALTVTNQNIANAQNPYYTRRVVDFQEAKYGPSGNGTILLDVRRIFDDVTNRNLIRTKSENAAAESYSQQLKDFEPLLSDSTTNIASYMKQSLTQLNGLNSNASSTQGRNLYLNQLDAVAKRFNQVSQQIHSDARVVGQALTADVAQVNLLTQQIAKINNEIERSGFPNGQENMALMDDRDRLLNTLAEYISFDSSTDQYGGVTVQIGSGVPLVYGSRSTKLMTTPSVDDPHRLDIAIDNAGYPERITSFVNGGKIAGALSFQKNGLESSEIGLDRLALALAFKINAQHQLGMDSNGQLGGVVFKDMNSADIASQRVLAQTTNVGSGTFSVGITDVTQLSLSDYELTFSSATQYQLLRKSDNQEVSSGSVSGLPFALSADGFSVTINSGSFVAGDVFTVSPTHGAADYLQLELTSPAQLALGFPVATSPSVRNTGSGSIKLDTMTDTTTSVFATPGQLTPPVIVDFFSPTQYRLLSATDNSIIEDNLSYDPAVGAALFPTPGGYDPGYRASISGEMHTADQFYIDYNNAGFSDNRNGLLLADLYQQGIVDGGTLTFMQGYNSIVDDISSKTNVARINETAQGIIKTQAELRRDQLSGVSLEEEAMNVARFQEAYQASAQILDTVKTMFDVVLNLMRR
ncbi:MAG: flagellar hook-associated protein FlgK [Legionellales bacterium]